MVLGSFEKRIEAPKPGGIPQIVLMMGSAAPIFLGGAVMIPVLPVKIMFSILAGLLLIGSVLAWYHYDDYLVWKVLWMGRKMKKTPELSAADRFCYVDGFTWKSFLDEHTIAHSGGAVSIAFTWDGVRDRHSSNNEHQSELARRVALIKSLPSDRGIVMENHLIRGRDERLIDAYLAEAKRMDAEKPSTPIVRDIKNQLAEMYRPMARSNSVCTVLSIGPGNRERGNLNKLLWAAKNTATGRYRNQKKLAQEVRELASRMKNDFPGFKLLTKDEYQQLIQQVQQPYLPSHGIEWRFNLAEQLAMDKPVWDGDCIRVRDSYFSCLLIQVYPNMTLGWTHGFIEAPIDSHVCQIIAPTSMAKALDANKDEADFDAITISEKRGTDLALSKLSDAKQYRHYVANRHLPVADNAYIVTFSSKSKQQLMHFTHLFKRSVVENNEGAVRDGEYIQMEMFRIRLPGMGRSSYFFREDHGETLAAMMPYTTFPHGVDRPEALRLDASGQPVGFAPSTLKVPGRLVVAEMGGGKDTNEGLFFAETHQRIRYDFFEMGNSYQGVVEAVDGRYCRALEQVINPLATYEEYASSSKLAATGAGSLDAAFIMSQTSVLAPIINGIKGTDLTRPQENFLQKTVRYVYDNPLEKEAPMLPDILEACDKVEPGSEAQEEAKSYIKNHLFEFLDSETGKRFCHKDQFVISPIANAIDFDKFSGELFDFYMTFIATRMVTNAMSRGVRSQIVLNEYKVLLERAPDAIRWITISLDRMGRKEWTGLTRISQGLSEIQSIDAEGLDYMPCRMLLSRRTNHDKIGELLDVPKGIVSSWRNFQTPEIMDEKGYREGLIYEREQWHKLHLQFPKLLLDLMNTQAADKEFRDESYRRSKDPYERIQIFKEIKKQATAKQKAKEMENGAII